jgi:hypothetical protein
MTLLFIEKTWFLWWMFVIVVILRWFHVCSGDIHVEAENVPIAPCRDEEPSGNRLASRA